MLVGYNISTVINHKTLDKAIQDGCNSIQVFTSDPCSFFSNVKNFNGDLLKTYKKDKKLDYVIHGSFLINFCRLPEDKITKNSINLLKRDLYICEKIKALGVIIHMGKDTGKLGEEKAFNMYVNNLNKVLEDTKHLKSIIILETGAGCGTEVATRLNDLAKIREFSINKERVKFCIDTCHIYSAGYDLSDELFVDSLDDYIDNTLGWENVIVAHINDSKECYNSRKDKHADILDGDISKKDLKAFKKFLNYFKKRNIPMILETPSDTIDYKTQLDLLNII
jgi:deoxyribonuclease-4